MIMSRQEIKKELKTRSEKIWNQVNGIFGDHARDIDFSCIELFTVLFYHEMRHEPENPAWAGRDRLVVTNLKVIPSLFALLADLGYISWKEFQSLVIKLPKLFSNPNLALVNYPGVEIIIDSPYMGAIQSLGYAVSGTRSRLEYSVYHITTEKCTPLLQEALLTASSQKLVNFTSIIPFLDVQQRSSAIHFWFSMGWKLEEIRFDDLNNIFEGFARASRGRGKPKVLMG